jgi:hypothetical protein
MNVRIQIQSPGLHLNSMLKAEALPELIELVQKHRITDPEKLAKIAKRARKLRMAESPDEAPKAAVSPAPELKPRSIKVRTRVSKVPVQRVLNATAGLTFPERIVALTGWLQGQNEGQTVRPRDIKQLLVNARQDPPANPGRDFRLAWDQGWLVRLQPREFVLSNAGWAKLAEMLNASLPKKQEPAATAEIV